MMRIRTSMLMGVGLVLIGAVAQAASAQPDFSGIWTSYRAPRPPAPAGGAPAAPPGGARLDTRAQFAREAPFTPEAKAKVDEYRALVAPNQENPGGYCLGTGLPGSMMGAGGYPMEIIQRPEQITVIYEAHTELRRIYIGGPKVDPNDLVPSRNGYSVGHWEGDTLVVETSFLKESVDQSMAHSDQARIVERYSMSKDKDANGNRVLQAEMTMTDPAFYTKPITGTKKWSAMPTGRMMVYDCNEPAWEDHVEELRKAAAAKQPAAK